MAFFTLIDGRKLYYEMEGQGHPIVFIHGWKASADVYEEPSHILAGQYTCIRYDHCGHKRSEAPEEPATLDTLVSDLRQLVLGLELDKPLLVGWSMGGLTLMEYVRRFGCGEISGAVIVDVTPRFLADEGWLGGRLNGGFTKEMLEEEFASLDTDFYAYLRNYYAASKRTFSELSEDEQHKIVLERCEGFDIPTIVSLKKSISCCDYRDVIGTIDVPAALFPASLKPLCNAAATAFYKEQLGDKLSVYAFEDASHDLIVEYPDKFAEALGSFIEDRNVFPI